MPNKTKKIRVISREKAISIIKADFRWAEALYPLPQDEIQKILAYDPPHHSATEILRKIHAYKLIADYHGRR